MAEDARSEKIVLKAQEAKAIFALMTARIARSNAREIYERLERHISSSGEENPTLICETQMVRYREEIARQKRAYKEADESVDSSDKLLDSMKIEVNGYW